MATAPNHIAHFRARVPPGGSQELRKNGTKLWTSEVVSSGSEKLGWLGRSPLSSCPVSTCLRRVDASSQKRGGKTSGKKESRHQKRESPTFARRLSEVPRERGGSEKSRRLGPDEAADTGSTDARTDEGGRAFSIPFAVSGRSAEGCAEELARSGGRVEGHAAAEKATERARERDATTEMVRERDVSLEESRLRAEDAEGLATELVAKVEGYAQAAGRDEVLRACTVTSAALAAAGLVARQASSWAASAGLPIHNCIEDVSFSFDLSPADVVSISLTVGLVSLARLSLLSLSPPFAAATHASNRQTLTNLSAVELLPVSFLPGVSEEFVFRGALLPLVGANPAGVLLSGVVFGALHITGGRNLVFALWATSVGVAYGCLTLYTSNVLCPMLAHSVANLLSAAYWKLKEHSPSHQ